MADPELLRPIMEQSATYLSTAFEEAERRYSSFGRFVTHGLEVSDAMVGELRRALLGDPERYEDPVREGRPPGPARATGAGRTGRNHGGFLV